MIRPDPLSHFQGSERGHSPRLIEYIFFFFFFFFFRGGVMKNVHYEIEKK